MLTKVFVYTALFATSALGAAVSAPVDAALVPVYLHDTVAAAEYRGIDVRGPIPSDAKKDENGVYICEPDSDAAAWVRAQLSLGASSDTKKRELANIGIGMFSDNNCLGTAAWIDNVSYGDSVSRGGIEFKSVGISFRAMRSGEHLDFSRRGPSNNLCETYLYSAAPFTGVGCFNSQPINCFHFFR